MFERFARLFGFFPKPAESVGPPKRSCWGWVAADDDDDIGLRSHTLINPATGLSMGSGGVDTAGCPFGVGFNWDD